MEFSWCICGRVRSFFVVVQVLNIGEILLKHGEQSKITELHKAVSDVITQARYVKLGHTDKTDTITETQDIHTKTHTKTLIMYCKVRHLYCIVFIHFYSASHSLSLSEALPTTAIDTVLEFTRQSATGNCG